MKKYKTYKHNGKEFRVYIWENKPVSDFIYPKGFRMAEFQEFVDLYDSGKIELEFWKYYFVKHFSKLQQNKEYCLSGLFLDWCSGLFSVNGDLAYSDDDGRVVLCKDVDKLRKIEK